MSGPFTASPRWGDMGAGWRWGGATGLVLVLHMLAVASFRHWPPPPAGLDQDVVLIELAPPEAVAPAQPAVAELAPLPPAPAEPAAIDRMPAEAPPTETPPRPVESETPGLEAAPPEPPIQEPPTPEPPKPELPAPEPLPPEPAPPPVARDPLPAKPASAPPPPQRPASPRRPAPATVPAAPASSTPQPAPPQPATPPASAAAASWQARLAAHLNRFKRYPAAAQMRRQQGVAMVRLRLMPDGSAQAVALQAGSGSDILDQEALALVTRAQPLPVPDGGASVDVIVPVHFTLR